MRRILPWLLMFMAVPMAAPAGADGEPTAGLSDTGVIVPVDEPSAYVLDQRVTITLPPPDRPGPRFEPKPAAVRVEYLLTLPDYLAEKGQPLKIWVGWPSGGIHYHLDTASGDWEPYRSCLPFIKFDGKPVGHQLLSFDDLADQYVGPWLERIDKLLDSRPTLKEQVLKWRQADEQAVMEYAQSIRVFHLDRAHALGHWMEANGLLPTERSSTEPEYLASGLLGIGPPSSGNRRDECVQHALQWLDPSYQPINVYPLLSERWSHDTRLLDPNTGQLYDTREGMITEDEPQFAVFRFPISLQPGRQHRLVVQYGQFLGWSDDGWKGLVYLMEPARRWGRWEKTTIEVRVPTEWRKVAIRPPARKTAVQGGLTVYRISMDHRPWENLYVSVSKDPAKPRPRVQSSGTTKRPSARPVQGRPEP